MSIFMKKFNNLTLSFTFSFHSHPLWVTLYIFMNHSVFVLSISQSLSSNPCLSSFSSLLVTFRVSKILFILQFNIFSRLKNDISIFTYIYHVSYCHVSDFLLLFITFLLKITALRIVYILFDFLTQLFSLQVISINRDVFRNFSRGDLNFFFFFQGGLSNR